MKADGCTVVPQCYVEYWQLGPVAQTTFSFRQLLAFLCLASEEVGSQ